MRRILALVVLAVLGFAAAGCASARKGGSASVVINTIDSKSPSGTIYVTGTETIAGLKVGTPIACKGGEPIVTVPAGETRILGAGRWSKVAAVSGPSPETRIDLMHHANGTVTVSCSGG